MIFVLHPNLFSFWKIRSSPQSQLFPQYNLFEIEAHSLSKKRGERIAFNI